MSILLENKKEKNKIKEVTTVNKDDLIRKVAKNGGFYNSHVKRYLEVICETILDTLSEGEDIRLSGFGTFSSVVMPEKESVLRGEKYTIPSYRKVYFKASPKAKEIFFHENKEDENHIE